MFSFADATVVDLSIGIEPGIASEPTPASVDDHDHERGAENLAGTLQEMGLDVGADDFPDGIGLALEEAHAITHTAYGFDKPFDEMGRRFLADGDGDELRPARFAGREVEYCQIEKMANLDALPRKTDVPLVTAPVTVADASAGWVRPVALFGEAA